MTKPSFDDERVARKLREAADILQAQRANPFRGHAYRRAADRVAALDRSWDGGGTAVAAACGAVVQLVNMTAIEPGIRHALSSVEWRYHAASNVALRVSLDPNTRPIAIEWLERHKLRNFGSVVLHLAYAALGALDVILDHQAALWDVAGGAALLLEAGGRITDVHGQPLFPFPVVGYRGQPLALLAGNPLAHAEAVAACRAVLEPVR